MVPPGKVEGQNAKDESAGSDSGSGSSLTTMLIDFSLPYKEALRHFEQEYTGHVLKECGGNISKAAKALQMQRSSLYNILNRAQCSEQAENTEQD